MVRQERHGRSAGGGFRLGRDAQALCLPRPVARPQGRAVLASDGALARSLVAAVAVAALGALGQIGGVCPRSRPPKSPPPLWPKSLPVVKTFWSKLLIQHTPDRRFCPNPRRRVSSSRRTTALPGVLQNGAYGRHVECARVRVRISDRQRGCPIEVGLVQPEVRKPC